MASECRLFSHNFASYYMVSGTINISVDESVLTLECKVEVISPAICAIPKTILKRLNIGCMETVVPQRFPKKHFYNIEPQKSTGFDKSKPVDFLSHR